MQTKSEPNVWRTITSIAITIVLLFGAIHFYDLINEPTEPIVEPYKYQVLIDNPDYYITPQNYNVTDLVRISLNDTKNLNTPHCITIFSYLRKNFTSCNDVKPRPPVETISRGSGSYLNLNLLYTSMLLHLGYDAYLVISEMPGADVSLTLLFHNNLTYIFDLRYYNPTIIDVPDVILDNENYVKVLLISSDYSEEFGNLEFYIFVRDNNEYL